MNRIDYYKIGFLMLIPLLVFFPAFYTHYFYTDELVQLWLYRKGSDFAMFVSQGRLLNDWLFRYLYSHIDTIDQLARLHIFALLTWLISIPIWYRVLVRITREEKLPEQLPFFAVLFLVTSLPFGIAVQWASCMELPIANTCGLLAGYLVYRYDWRGWLPAMLLGLIATFFYQNALCCFILPFFLQLIARRKTDRSMLRPLLFYFAICIVYFLLLKLLLHTIYHTNFTDRGALADDPIKKLGYLIFVVLPCAFHFNVVASESSNVGRFIFFGIAGACLWFDLSRLRPEPGKAVHRAIRERLFYAVLLGGAFILLYLPSMIIKENYASNRTLLALDLAAFLWVFSTLLQVLKTERLRWITSATAGALLVVLSFYNYRVIFLPPAIHEYTAMKTFFDKNYDPKITPFRQIHPGRGGERTPPIQGVVDVGRIWILFIVFRLGARIRFTPAGL